MRLPKNLNEVTVEQFQECYFLLNGKATDDTDPIFLEPTRWANVIACLSKVDPKVIKNLPGNQFKYLTRKLSFLKDDERLNTKVKKYILVNKTVYKAVWEADKLSTSQAFDIKTFCKPETGMSQRDTVVENLHKLLASIYLPLKKLQFTYSGTDHEKISNDFKKAKMGDVAGTLFFYSLVSPKLTEAMLDFGEKPMQMLTEHMKEVNDWAKSSQISGDGK